MILPFTPKLEYDLESPLYNTLDQILTAFMGHLNETYILQILMIPPEYIQDEYIYHYLLSISIKHQLPSYWLDYNTATGIYQDALRHYDGRDLFDLTNFLEEDVDDLEYNYDHQYERNDIDKAIDLVRQDILESVFLLI